MLISLSSATRWQVRPPSFSPILLLPSLHFSLQRDPPNCRRGVARDPLLQRPSTNGHWLRMPNHIRIRAAWPDDIHPKASKKQTARARQALSSPTPSMVHRPSACRHREPWSAARDQVSARALFLPSSGPLTIPARFPAWAGGGLVLSMESSGWSVISPGRCGRGQCFVSLLMYVPSPSRRPHRNLASTEHVQCHLASTLAITPPGLLPKLPHPVTPDLQTESTTATSKCPPVWEHGDAFLVQSIVP